MGAPPAVAAGALAVLAFYTRLNNLLMALGLIAFALPLRMPFARSSGRASGGRVSRGARQSSFAAVIGLGLLFFAWRTWYYTGVFSLFHGTPRYLVAIWQPDMPLRTVAVLDGLQRDVTSSRRTIHRDWISTRRRFSSAPLSLC